MNTSRFSTQKLRQARGVRSFEEVAGALRVSHQTIRNWESGKGQPDASQLAAIAELTGKSLDFFFQREGGSYVPPLRRCVKGGS